MRCAISVIGAGENATAKDMAAAEELGELIALQRWVVLSGGRNVGIMHAVNVGAKRVPDGLTIGIIPHQRTAVSESVDVAIVTDMNNARNNIIALSGDVIVACGVGGAGTASEIALAMKAGKDVIFLNGDPNAVTYFQALAPARVHIAADPAAVIDTIRGLKPAPCEQRQSHGMNHTAEKDRERIGDR